MKYTDDLISEAKKVIIGKDEDDTEVNIDNDITTIKSKKNKVVKQDKTEADTEADTDAELDKDIESDPELANSNPELSGDEMPEDAETDEVSFSEKKNNFQKYILYYKLRQLEYKLNDYKVMQSYKDVKKLKEFLNLLNNFLIFYDVFDYKQASNLAIQILDKFKRIK